MVRRAAPKRIYLKDGIMRDGPHRSRARCAPNFDSGAYTRLSSYAAVKCAAQFARALYDPEMFYGDIYCVFTNTAHRRPRCAASASPRWIFAIECQMDKARLISSAWTRWSFRIPQRLSRTAIMKGASARGEEHRLDRMRPGRRPKKSQMAAARAIQADVLAQGRRRWHGLRFQRPRWTRSRRRPSRCSAAAHDLRSRPRRRAQRTRGRRLPRSRRPRRHQPATPRRDPVFPPCLARGGADP